MNTNKTLLSTVLIASLLSTPSMAGELTTGNFTEQRIEQKKDNENIGFGTGMAIGALVAGPFGAIFAGVTGVFIAKHINANEDVEQLNIDLAQTTKDHQYELARFQDKLNSAENDFQTELANLRDENHESETFTEQLQAENLLMSLQFSTGSSEISAHYQEQVSALAHILNGSSMMKIDLSGYTDLEGETKLNQQLSQARVESVKMLLMAQGVNEGQITTYAYGEEAPIVATNEKQVSFYDRRVVLKLHNPLSQTAQR